MSQNKRSLDHGQDTGWSGDNTGFGVTQTSVRILLLLVQFARTLHIVSASEKVSVILLLLFYLYLNILLIPRVLDVKLGSPAPE